MTLVVSIVSYLNRNRKWQIKKQKMGKFETIAKNKTKNTNVVNFR